MRIKIWKGRKNSGKVTRKKDRSVYAKLLVIVWVLCVLFWWASSLHSLADEPRQQMLWHQQFPPVNIQHRQEKTMRKQVVKYHFDIFHLHLVGLLGCFVELCEHVSIHGRHPSHQLLLHVLHLYLGGDVIWMRERREREREKGCVCVCVCVIELNTTIKTICHLKFIWDESERCDDEYLVFEDGRQEGEEQPSSSSSSSSLSSWNHLGISSCISLRKRLARSENLCENERVKSHRLRTPEGPANLIKKRKEGEDEKSGKRLKADIQIE